MRLIKKQHYSIKQSFLESLGEEKIYLFLVVAWMIPKEVGILICILSPPRELSVATLFEQKIDILLSKDKSRPIEKETLPIGKAL